MKSFYKKGAEAELKEVTCGEEKAISKKRFPKNYRNEKLDFLIRSKRTRAETKLLREASKVINTPKIISVDEEKTEIILEYIQGKQLKEIIEKKPALCILAGEKIRALHDIGVIHGDLTTSNIIVADNEDLEMNKRIQKKGELFFIDFGLGFFSKKIEDKATDLVVFKKTFNATHPSIRNGWELVMKGYAPNKEIITRMSAIEKRARYH